MFDYGSGYRCCQHCDVIMAMAKPVMRAMIEAMQVMLWRLC